MTYKDGALILQEYRELPRIWEDKGMFPDLAEAFKAYDELDTIPAFKRVLREVLREPEEPEEQVLTVLAAKDRRVYDMLFGHEGLAYSNMSTPELFAEARKRGYLTKENQIAKTNS